MSQLHPGIAPLPTSPTRGEVPLRELGTMLPQPLFTSPLMGGGRGWASASEARNDH